MLGAARPKKRMGDARKVLVRYILLPSKGEKRSMLQSRGGRATGREVRQVEPLNFFRKAGNIEWE